ncbi:MAG: transglutaminase family protein [Campylobacterales bacterium]|nr:transglutaminase family protein [Campylobacterales bacterium]
MTYQIYHKSTFYYQQLVTFSHNLARLKPRETPFQKLASWRLEVAPEAAMRECFDDYFGNAITHLLVREAHTALEVTAHSQVTIDSSALQAYYDTARAHPLSVAEALTRLGVNDPALIDIKQYLFPSVMVPGAGEAIRLFALESFISQRPLFEAAMELMERIFEEFTFESGFSDISTPVEEVFEARKGVCQDFAHLAIAALRALGFAARYVSGYIETTPPEGEEKLFGADASHAWFSLYIPDVGWVDFDPTNNLLPLEKHIVLGWGRDYADVAPLQGVVRSSGESSVGVMVDVRSLE